MSTKRLAYTDDTFTGTWNGTAVGVGYGGTGATTATIGGKAGIALCSDSGGAPGSILAQGEVVTSGLGIITTSVSQAVTAGTLYWLILVTNNSVNVFDGIGAASRQAWLGYDLASGAPAVAEYVAYTYAAPIVLPSFASPTLITTGATFFPTVFVRWSA